MIVDNEPSTFVRRTSERIRKNALKKKLITPAYSGEPTNINTVAKDKVTDKAPRRPKKFRSLKTILTVEEAGGHAIDDESDSPLVFKDYRGGASTSTSAETTVSGTQLSTN